MSPTTDLLSPETAVPRARRSMAALRELHATGTPSREVLLGFAGWGTLANCFANAPKGAWLEMADELEELLSPAEFNSARDGIDTSFFTPAFLTTAVFTILSAAGFTGGRILEPGCGSGRFMAASPYGDAVTWTGVESDPVAARFAAVLNPEATIIGKPFEKVALPSESFDAVVGNLPFSPSRPYDPAFMHASSLHEFFALKSLDYLRPGGYAVFVTSRHTMDSENGLTHILGTDEYGAHAELIAAIRLPSGAFASAGTEVVSNLLVLRKRVAGEPRRGWDDAAENAGPRTAWYPYRETSLRDTISEPVDPEKPSHNTVVVNSYWGKNPAMVAGIQKVSTFDRNPLVVVSNDIEGDVARAVAAVIPKLIPQTDRIEFDAAADLADVTLHDATGRKENSFHVVDDVMHEVVNGKLTPARNSAELRALIELRDEATVLIALESDFTLPDTAIDEARTATLTSYTAYVTRFGALNRGTLTTGKPDPETGEPTFSWRRPALGGFRRDPDQLLVAALEVFDQDDGTSAPAPILLRRVNHAPVPVVTAANASEALAISLGEGRGIDLARIAGLLGLRTAAEAVAELEDLVYQVDGEMVSARDYLSGNVRQKLDDARRAVIAFPSLSRNVTALEAVQPVPLDELSIKVSLGAPWVAAADVTAFAQEVLGSWSRVEFTPEVAVWEIVNGYRNGNTSHDAKLNFGTSRVTPLQVLEHALNGTSLVVYDESYVWGSAAKVRNIPETIAAAERMSALDDRFSTWIWEDADRAARVAAEYNLRFNSHRTREVDGSHLTFPGMAEEVTPWAHQRNICDQIASTPRVLVGHAVGAGKTLSALMAVMTLRRLGLANKPMIVVPAHLLEQASREAKQAFPTGRFLIATKEDVSREKRRLFAARCATQDWDCVIATHGVFSSLAVAPDVEEAWIQAQKSDLREAEFAAAALSSGSRGKGAKAIARAIRALEARLGALRNVKADKDQILFDHLGIDWLGVDEAHYYRRLSTTSGNSRENGFGSGSSKRATDLLLKIEVMAAKYGTEKPLVGLFTGTPWSNTLAETYTWQRYLQPEALEAAGVKQFDSWVASFIRYSTQVEVAPDGSGFRMQKRPVGIKNAPELMSMFSQVSSILSAEAIGLPRPTHEVHNMVAAPSPEQHSFVKSLAARAEATRNGGKPQRPNGEGDDNMLLICNDGRAAALDPQLVGIDETSTKLIMVATKIADIYEETKNQMFGNSPKPGALQLAMLDLGTPRPGDGRVYGRLRALLISRGVPAGRIRFVHDSKTDAARAHLFREAREGDISVLLGSTSKLGTGVNAQTRLSTIHHVDAPYLPSEVEQREGRALRPRNLNPHVHIYRYVTEHSFDAYLWQLLERKARGFAKLYDPSPTDREIEDISAVAMSYADVKALASGNPALKEQAEVSSTVSKLRLLRSVYLQGVNRATRRAADCRAESDRRRAENKKLRAVGFLLEGAEADEEKDKQGVLRLAQMIAAKDLTARHQVGTWHGLGLRISSRNGADRRGVIISLSENWNELGTIEIASKSQRRGVEIVTAELLAEFRQWAEKVPKRIVFNEERIAALTAESAEADATVEHASFDQEYELEFAIQRLAGIDAAINDEATETTNQKTAA